jgi:ribosome-binding protein aMBF1 (putative translation factor)
LHAILGKLESIDQTLKSIELKIRKSSGISTELLSVNDLVMALQMKYPQKTWTADELAEKIGCTGSAVRKTESWKIHQKHQYRQLFGLAEIQSGHILNNSHKSTTELTHLLFELHFFTASKTASLAT